MRAFVVPYRKTPRGIDGFDYRIPPNLVPQIKPGVIVQVPMRKRTITGLVFSISDTDDGGNSTVAAASKTKAPLKDIIAVSELPFWRTPERLHYLEWFARHHWVSLPTAWKTMQFLIGKRAFKRPNLGSLTSTTESHGSRPEGDAINESILLFSTRTEQYTAYKNILDTYKGLVCVITPEEIRTESVSEQLQNVSEREWIILDSHIPPTAWTDLQLRLLDPDTDLSRLCIVGTKKMLFLALPKKTHVIIDDEHEKSHKQYDANPRYRSTTLAERLAGQRIVEHVTYASYSPSLHLWKRLNDNTVQLEDVRNTETAAPVEVIDMNNLQSTQHPGWLSIDAVDAIERDERLLFFLNRVGHSVIYACRSCGHTISRSMERCSECGDPLLQMKRKGVHQLAEEFQRLFPHRRFAVLDQDAIEGHTREGQKKENLDSGVHPLHSAQIILATEKVFRVPPKDLPTFDRVFVLSVDHLLVYPHFSAQERVFQILLQLQLITPRLSIQTHAAHLPLFHDIATQNIKHFAESELVVRKMLKLPPVSPQWAVINPITKATERIQDESLLKNVSPEMQIDSID